MAVSFQSKSQAAPTRCVYALLLLAVSTDAGNQGAASTDLNQPIPLPTDLVLLRREKARRDSLAQQDLEDAGDQATESGLEQLRVGTLANASVQEIRSRQRLDDLQAQVDVAGIELAHARAKLAAAKGEVPEHVAALLHGHILPPHDGHWKWSNAYNSMMFESNGGWSQAKLDEPGTVAIGLGSSKEMVDAIDYSPGSRVDFNENSVNNEKKLRDAAYYTGGRWVWDHDKLVSRVHEVPRYDRTVGDGISPITKYYHAMWRNQSTHLKSAYEPDFFRDNSEFFGPFRLDYDTNTIWLTDWNLKVQAKDPISTGRGNMLIGPDHFYQFATNSFASGKQNSLRGDGHAILGGTANMARGARSTVVGGEGNAAKRVGSSITGGFHNEAVADLSHISGGARNRVEAKWGAIGGGETNIVQAEHGVVLAGEGNKATGVNSAVHGGAGNKAMAPESTVSGGQGGKATKRYEVMTGVMPLEDQQTEQKMAAMQGEVTATGGMAAPPH